MHLAPRHNIADLYLEAHTYQGQSPAGALLFESSLSLGTSGGSRAHRSPLPEEGWTLVWQEVGRPPAWVHQARNMWLDQPAEVFNVAGDGSHSSNTSAGWSSHMLRA